MKNLITEYPSWAIALCPLVGLGYSLLLYFRDKRLTDLSSFSVGLLGFFRFSVITILAFLILGPLVRYFKTEVEPPTVVLAIDNSNSMILGVDSAKTRAELKSAIAELEEKLGSDYQLTTYTFGQKIEPGIDTAFSEPTTDVSALFESLKGRYVNRNLGAIILATDGIYNRGSNPRYTMAGLGAPVYSIAFGDTVHRRDVLITEIAANRIAFLKNKFPVEAKIRADKLDGKEIAYQISSSGKVLSTGSFTAKGDNDEHAVRFLIDADKPGRQTYTVIANPVSGEVTRANNSRSVYIDIIDGREKVLILGQAPHPDIVALREAISQNENYEVDVQFEKDFTGNLKDYSVVILNQIPGRKTPTDLVNKISAANIPIFAIVGGQSTISGLKPLGLGVDLGQSKASFNDVGGAVNASFSLFKIDENFNTYLADAPPLRTPFGKWQISNAFEAALYQKVGNIATTDPLLIVNKIGKDKSAVLLGEGIWRWRLYDFQRNENHTLFDSFFGSIVQYLSVKEDKRLFRVQAPANNMENESLILTAELYNEAFEPVNDTEVGIVFTDADGRSFPFTFSRTDIAYRLDAGALPVGNYTYLARVERNGKEFVDKGGLTIRPFALEGAELMADHSLLNSLAENSGGAMVYPNNVDSLVIKIKASNTMQPVSYSTEVLSSVLNLKWPFFLILLLLSLEWFIRKRSGHY